MVSLSALWLPILLAAIVVFLTSSVLHMALPWHRSDFRKVPRENEVMDALRTFGIPPGDYMLPCAERPEVFKTPEFQEKFAKGPVLLATVLPQGPPTMGKSLAWWFVYLLVVSLFAGYVASRALPAGADYTDVFRFTGTVAFVGYALALWQNTIWYRRALTTTVKNTIDGLIYALLTAGVFGWLWPGQ